MEQILLVRYVEIHLKGLNRPFFEKKLVENMEKALGGDGTVERAQGRIYVRGFSDGGKAARAVSRVFGVHSVSLAWEMDKDVDVIAGKIVELLGREVPGTFKIKARRSDKTFSMNSMQLNQELGFRVLTKLPGFTVDVHRPRYAVGVEIRERAYVYLDAVPGVGGMPTGTSGRVAVLLSGGIDSPVAAWRMAKRGVTLTAVHFESPPYTSARARSKVVDLARIVSTYSGPVRLFVVPFTDVQTTIYEKCPDSQLTLITRRFMMRIAEAIARRDGAAALVTGESLAQVASQTLESLAATDQVVGMPVFRPLIAMDKMEIMDEAKAIGTYDTSILPYEDCCTVFLPRHPSTHPKLAAIEAGEQDLDVAALVDAALAKAELVEVTP